ncbi:MAG TPA: hypothetical protein VGD10_02175 [Allosphingosinicella sp.]|uniref:hypothetical protein n=1 Tax=Allosphingosinicella sp. TaxID=2823234 RepID=UPI002ED932B1
MGKTDFEYFSRRMREEKDAAARATPIASQIHKELADRYAGVVAAYEKGRKEA